MILQFDSLLLDVLEVKSYINYNSLMQTFTHDDKSLKISINNFIDSAFFKDLVAFTKNGKKLTSENVECFFDKIFSSFDGYKDLTDKHIFADCSIGSKNISIKGSLIKFQPRNKKYVLTITQQRTTSFPDFKQKINFLNDSFSKIDYEFVFCRYVKDDYAYFLIFSYQKNLLKLDIDSLSPNTKNSGNKSGNINYSIYNGDDNLKFNINTSASSQLTISIADVFDFISKYNGIIYYNNLPTN